MKKGKLIFCILIVVFLLLVSAFAIRQALTPDIRVVVGVPTGMEDGHVSGVRFAASSLRDAVLMVEGKENAACFVDVWLHEDSLFYALESTEEPVFHQSNIYIEKISEILKN